MLNSKKSPGRRRPGKNTFTTKSGNSIKVNRSLGERVRASREAKARKRAAYLSTLPQGRVKRILYRLHPKRVFKYWFSREGAIMALKIMGIGIVVCFLLLVGVFAYFRKDLPNITSLASTQGSIMYYDRTGQTVLWQDYDGVKNVPVASDKISKYVKDATIAIEDKNYYKHGAFDVQGIMRAGLNDVFNHGGAVQGGSTITQQLVKINQGWTQDRSIARKFKELILAVELEREYSKDDILTGYLNTAPYGNVQNGVESASQDYFGKSAKDLNLAEAAMMASIPQSPSYYSPYGPIYEPAELLGRQHYVLDQMVDQKMVTKEEAEAAKKYDILATIREPQPKYDGIKAPYFVLAAKQELEEKYGSKTIQRGGWKVTTTLDIRLQDLAETQVKKNMTQVRKQGGDTSAFAAIDVKTAQMVALVGGPDFNEPKYGQVNYAQRWIPPGSSFKPYDYASMINETENTGAGSVLYDTQAALPGYSCTNKARPKDGGNCLTDYDFRYPGPVTIRYALGGSRNVPAVKAMLTVGTNKVIQIAQDMGLKSGYKCFEPGDASLTQEAQCYGSSAIGDGAYLHLDEHVNALATLSRLGEALPQTYILKITDSRDKGIYEWKQPKGKQVLKPDSAYIVNDILSDPKASYLRTDRKFHNYKGWKFAIKTGTTNDAKDGLMVSYSAQYASAVWVGSNIPKEMSGAMENMTQPVIQGWMQGAHDPIKAGTNWVAPTTIKTLPAYVIRNKISNQAEIVPSPANDIYPSWYKQTAKQGTGSQTLDKVSNKIATACTPELAKENQGNANDNVFSADNFVGNRSGASAAGNDDVHNCGDAKPQITLTAPATCAGSCTFTVTVTQGTHPLTSDKFAGAVELYVGGQKIESQGVSTSPSTISFTYTPTTTGPAEIQAKVIDSVLYDSSESATVTMTAGGP
ncbi:MAG: transglycosylase domain-containing protein [Candidatus Saccharimonadales bacterium]